MDSIRLSNAIEVILNHELLDIHFMAIHNNCPFYCACDDNLCVGYDTDNILHLDNWFEIMQGKRLWMSARRKKKVLQ